MTPRQLILGTAGHIDHGKTALVRALTGTDTDRLPQEKERGITIDIGFAHLDLGDWQLGIVDVPGHERFIKNMLAGAAGVDIALLVVAADDSVMPQTLEHLSILELLQVKHGLIAITKADLADPDWLDLVEEDVRTMAEGTFLEGSPIVRTSATKRTGFDDLKAAVAEICADVDVTDTSSVFRMAIDRSFVMHGRGTIVTGTVWSGRASTGEEVQWLPEGKKLKIRGLQSHGRDAETVQRGQRAALNLQGVHHTEIGRGNELATPNLLRPTRRITVHVRVLKDSPLPVRHRAHLRLHLGTQEVISSVRLLRGTTIEPGEQGFAQLICAEPIVAMARQPFVIRCESPVITLGGGTVIQPTDRRISRRDPDAIDRLEGLTSDDELTRAAAAAYFNLAGAFTELDLCREADIPEDRAAAVIGELLSSGSIAELTSGPRGVLRLHKDYLQTLRKRIKRVMKRLHDASPLESAIPRQRLAGKLSYIAPEVVSAVVDRLVAESQLVGDENAVALASFKPKLTATQLRLYEIIDDAYKSAGFSPPSAGNLAQEHAVDVAEVKPIIELAASGGHLVHLGGGMHIHKDCEEQLREKITTALAEGEGMTVSQIRDLLGITRKHAVPICEYLDRIGLTKRQGDLRVLKD